jgi:Zn-dependent peptidase ImmA (M78 family)
MISLPRKNQIIKLAESIANDFSDGNLTLLDSIAKDEELYFFFDNYEDAFDGMLVYDSSEFYIHINVDTGNRENSKRGRFTFAHELGHFFIDEHRLGLKYGLLEPHGSFHNLNQKNRMEFEADYFASCLLMPQDKFRKQSGGKKFSLDTILNLSESFHTSMLSTIIRFGEIGTHEIFAAVSKNNIAQWFVKSNDFPNWKFKFKLNEIIPKSTIASEYFNLERRKYDGIEKVLTDDWFSPPKDDNRADRQMYEQCYYSESYDYVISLVWFD